MSRFIVQAILYPEMRRTVDVAKIRMRRRHKTSIRMLRKKEGKNKKNKNDEASEEEEEAEFESDSESTEESEGSTASNPFGEIYYCTGHQRRSPVDREGTEYETFIDHCADCTKEVFDAVAKAKTDDLRVERDSKGNLCFTHFKDLEKIDDTLRDSLPYGSTVVRLREAERSQSKDIVHTSTAQIRINQQPSEQLSSFDQNTNKGGNFEDLSKLDDSMPMAMGLRQRTLLDERHSMPTLFVGNRFNSISATKIYIPSWKDRQDIQNSAVNCAEVGIEEKIVVNAPPLSHSSSVDVPCDKVLPLPDHVSVELLYNLGGEMAKGSCDSKSSLDVEEILKPPSMFKNDTPALSRDVSPFGKHQLNSDKRVSSSSSSASNPPHSQATEQKRNSRRCLTYQYVNLHNAATEGGGLTDTSTTPSDSQQNTSTGTGTSARSSDSGMAGSYTLPSPDPPKHPDEFFYAYEFDSHQGDLMDRAGTFREPPMRSPGLQHSSSSHNLGRVNMVLAATRGLDIDDHEDEGDVTDSGQYGDEGSLMKDFNEKYPYFQYEEQSISRGRTAIRNAGAASRSRSMDQRQRASNFTDTIVINIGNPAVNVIRLGGAHAPSVEKRRDVEDDVEERGKETVFRTGLYAHWWKKEKLPNEILKELFLKPNQQGHKKGGKRTCRKHNKVPVEGNANKSASKACQTSVHRAVIVQDGDVEKRIEKGSGKQRLLFWIGQYCDVTASLRVSWQERK